jgi:hypothetical protein
MRRIKLQERTASLSYLGGLKRAWFVRSLLVGRDIGTGIVPTEAECEERARYIRELEDRIANCKLPPPPRWRDSRDEKAVLDFIKEWHDIGELQARYDDYHVERVVVYVRERVPKFDLRDLSKMLRSGKEISNRALWADALDRHLDSIGKPKRKRGRQEKSIEQRRWLTHLPEAEVMCLAIKKFLKEQYPEQPAADVLRIAVRFTVKKFKEADQYFDIPPDVKLPKTLEITEEKLRNYVNRSSGHDRRLSPRPT